MNFSARTLLVSVSILSMTALTVTSAYGQRNYLTNVAPTISGTPSTTAVVGKLYSFKPRTADANGDTVAFSIRNKPAWALFNTSTGALWGTPTSAAMGVYSNIVIIVGDGLKTTALPAFSIRVYSSGSASSSSSSASGGSSSSSSSRSSVSSSASSSVSSQSSASQSTSSPSGSSQSSSSFSVTSITSNPGVTSAQPGAAATLGNPVAAVVNGLRTVSDTQVRFPSHAVTAAVGSMPSALSGEALPYVPQIRVLARRDSVILYFGNVAGAGDYRAYAVNNSVAFADSGNGKQPRGAVIACAGFRQHTYQSAVVNGYHTRELLQSIELPGFVNAGTYTIVVEATQTPCPFVGLPAHTDAQITMQNDGKTGVFHAADPANYRYVGIPRAVLKSFDSVKQLYGNEIINGQGSAMDFHTRDTAPVIGGAVSPTSTVIPKDPKVLARSAISVKLPITDESINAPLFDLTAGSNGVFEDFATNATSTPASMTQNPDYSAFNGFQINPLFNFNGKWQFWGRFMQAADSSPGVANRNYFYSSAGQKNTAALLGTQVFSRHGRLYTTFGDAGQDVGGTLGFASLQAPVQKMDSTKFIHSMFRVNSEASHRRYWWWTMCGAPTRADLFDDTTKTFKLRPTAFETSFNKGGNNPSVPDGRTIERSLSAADNSSARECLTIEQRGAPVNPMDTSGATRSSVVLRAMIHPAGWSHGARFLGNTLSDDNDSVRGFRYKVDAKGNRMGPMVEPFDQLAPAPHFDVFVRRDRLVVFVNGRQGFCVDLSDIPLTMNYGAIVYGDLLYHSSIEWQELSNSATNRDPQMYHVLMNSPIASSRTWDVISHSDGLVNIPAQFASYDPAACRKPATQAIQ